MSVRLNSKIQELDVLINKRDSIDEKLLIQKSRIYRNISNINSRQNDPIYALTQAVNRFLISFLSLFKGSKMANRQIQTLKEQVHALNNAKIKLNKLLDKNTLQTTSNEKDLQMLKTFKKKLHLKLAALYEAPARTHVDRGAGRRNGGAPPTLT